MPWASKKQSAWGHSVGVKALGGLTKIKEWDMATKGKFKSLPEKAPHQLLRRFQPPKRGK